MADISKIQIQNVTYDVKDETARNNLASYETSNNQEIANLKIPKKFFNGKKYILIGDSYADGYTPDGNVTSWQQLFVNTTGLSNTIQKHLGGTGFVNLVQNKNFQSLLEEVADDNNVTDIVVLGGYNDTSYNAQQIYNAINSFLIKAEEKFPNATVSIGFVGWSNTPNKLYPLSIVCQRYKESCGYFNCRYLNNMEFTLHNYFSDFSSDGFHPNSSGQTKLARNLVQSLMTGSANNQPSFLQIGLSYDSNISGTPFGGDLTCRQLNNLITMSLSSNKTINFVTPFDGSSSYTEVDIGAINSGYLVGTQYYLTKTSVSLLIHDTNGWYHIVGSFIIVDGHVKLQFTDINDAKTGYRSFVGIDQILIQGFSNSFDALYV